MYYCNLAPHTFVIAIQLYFFLIARSCCSFAHSWCANKYSAVPLLLLLLLRVAAAGHRANEDFIVHLVCKYLCAGTVYNVTYKH